MQVSQYIVLLDACVLVPMPVVDTLLTLAEEPVFYTPRWSIVSDNKKHFPKEALTPYGIECMTADEFIEHQYHLDEDAFIDRLTEQAARIGWPLTQLISKHVPCLARLIVGNIQ